MITLLLMSTVLNAQPPAVAPTTAPTTRPNLLDGPKVAEQAPAQPSIVRRAFDGTLEDIGAEIDVAAISALELTDQQRELFGTMLAARHSAFDAMVRNNYPLIVELASLQGESDPQKKLDAINKMRTAFADFFRRGLFVDEFGPHLTDAQRDQVNHMINEYREAKIKEIQREYGLRVPQAALRIRIDAFGHMVKDSIERQVSLEREQFEQISQELLLTEEQKNKAQAIFGPLAVKRLQNVEVTPAERADAFGKFNRELTPEQRDRLFAMLVRQWLPQQATTQQQAPASQPDAMK